MNNSKVSVATMLSVLLCFFTMGFVDLVGIASNYVQESLSLSDSQANIMPSLVFFWFLIFSVPTGMLMNKIGRKKTVMLSLVITLVSLIIPILGESYIVMLLAFSLLGIGNAFMQTSLNPLVSNIVSAEKYASTLTLGQFVKAIASFLAPYIAMCGATALIPTGGLDWRVLFFIFAIICILATVFLGFTKIEETPVSGTASFVECFKLLGLPYILLCFIGIMCHVGIDVGTNTTAPKILMERLGYTLNEASFATSFYFIFRTIGCLSGSVILRYLSAKRFFIISVVLMLIGILLLMFGTTQILLYTGIALVGFGNSNVFSIIFSQALLHKPEKGNEISGLMIMGLFGGTVFPLCMGYASDFAGTIGAVTVMLVGVVYLCVYSVKIKK